MFPYQLSNQPLKEKFSVGCEVCAEWNDGQWYSGIVESYKENAKGICVYNIRYDDDETTRSVPEHLVIRKQDYELLGDNDVDEFLAKFFPEIRHVLREQSTDPYERLVGYYIVLGDDNINGVFTSLSSAVERVRKLRFQQKCLQFDTSLCCKVGEQLLKTTEYANKRGIDQAFSFRRLVRVGELDDMGDNSGVNPYDDTLSETDDEYEGVPFECGDLDEDPIADGYVCKYLCYGIVIITLLMLMLYPLTISICLSLTSCLPHMPR